MIIKNSKKSLFTFSKVFKYATTSREGAQSVAILALTVLGIPSLYSLKNTIGNKAKVAVKRYQKTIFPRL